MAGRPRAGTRRRSRSAGRRRRGRRTKAREGAPVVLLIRGPAPREGGEAPIRSRTSPSVAFISLAASGTRHREAGQLVNPGGACPRASWCARLEQADVIVFDGGALGGEGRAQGRFVKLSKPAGDGELLPVAEEQRRNRWRPWAGSRAARRGDRAPRGWNRAARSHRGSAGRRRTLYLAGGRIAMGEAVHVAAGNRVPVHDDDACRVRSSDRRRARPPVRADDDDVSVRGSSQSQNAGVWAGQSSWCLGPGLEHLLAGSRASRSDVQHAFEVVVFVLQTASEQGRRRTLDRRPVVEAGDRGVIGTGHGRNW